MEFKDLIKNRRLKLGLTLEDVGSYVGVSRATVQRWESGAITNLKRDKIGKLAKVLECSPTYLLGWSDDEKAPLPKNIIPIKKAKTIPLIGTIACGTPILAQENWEDTIVLPSEVNADFALRCKGDSMVDARINDGDIVFIQQQSIVDNGEIAAVLIDGEATLKKFHRNGDTVVLQPANANYQPMIYSNEELNQISVIGKATHFLSSLNK